MIQAAASTSHALAIISQKILGQLARLGGKIYTAEACSVLIVDFLIAVIFLAHLLASISSSISTSSALKDYITGGDSQVWKEEEKCGVLHFRYWIRLQRVVDNVISRDGH